MKGAGKSSEGQRTWDREDKGTSQVLPLEGRASGQRSQENWFLSREPAHRAHSLGQRRSQAMTPE